MSTLVSELLSQIAAKVQEVDIGFPTGFWSQDEVITYINDACKQFVLESQIKKLIAAVASVTGQRIYEDPSYTMAIDRIAFNNKPLYRTTRMMLDRDNRKWRTLAGRPTQYHQDQLSTKHFEVDRAPSSSMTGTGYTVTGSYGTLRQMSGSRTYTATLPAGGGGGIFRYSIGTTAYNGILPHDRPYAGTLRQMFSGVTNFEVLATRLMDEVSSSADLMRVPDFCILYIKYGVLRRMLEKEGEGQDLARARYCGARYDFGVRLFRRLMDGSPITQQ